MTPEDSLVKMREASDQFYVAATKVQCHAFIEFTGLMNEYIKVCEANLKRGTDFRELNVHGEGQLHIEPYQLNYIRDKLNCIFQGALKVKRFPQNN